MSLLMSMFRLGFLFAVVLCMSLSTAAAQELSTNMVENASFESGGDTATSWSLGKEVFHRDTSVAKSGKASLRWSNTDPGIYRLTTQD